MARLRRELGGGDRIRVDQYLDSVREVERRIQSAERSDAAALPDLDRPASVPVVWEDHVKLMFDLQVLALQADMTRVITFQLARETSTRTYPHIGVPSRTTRCRTTNDPEKLVKLAKINAHHVSLFAYLLKGWRPLLTATVRCSITRCTCSAAAWAIPISTITRTCPSSLPEAVAPGIGAAGISDSRSRLRWRTSICAAGQGRSASRHVCGQHGSRVDLEPLSV